MAGFNALYSAQKETAEAAREAGAAVKGSIDGMNSNLGGKLDTVNSNLQGIKNGLVMGTNIAVIEGTNLIKLGNFADYQKSNVVAFSASTNSTGYTNGQIAAGVAAGNAALGTKADDFQTGLGSGDGVSLAGGDALKVTFNLAPGSPPIEVDLNPLSVPEVAGVAGFVRKCAAWGIVLAFASLFVTELGGCVRSAMMTPQATTAGGAVFGVSLGTISAPIMAAVITGAVGTLLVTAFTLFDFGLFSHITQDPFSGQGGKVATVILLIDAFFPIALFVKLSVAGVLVKIGLLKAYMVAASVVKFATGL